MLCLECARPRRAWESRSRRAPVFESAFLLDGQPIPPRGSEQFVRWRGVSPAYFRTMGIPLLKRSRFHGSRQAHPGGDCERKLRPKILRRARTDRLKCNLGEIVGVVGDCRDLSLHESADTTALPSRLQFSQPIHPGPRHGQSARAGGQCRNPPSWLWTRISRCKAFNL